MRTTECGTTAATTLIETALKTTEADTTRIETTFKTTEADTTPIETTFKTTEADTTPMETTFKTTEADTTPIETTFKTTEADTTPIETTEADALTEITLKITETDTTLNAIETTSKHTEAVTILNESTSPLKFTLQTDNADFSSILATTKTDTMPIETTRSRTTSSFFQTFTHESQFTKSNTDSVNIDSSSQASQAKTGSIKILYTSPIYSTMNAVDNMSLSKYTITPSQHLTSYMSISHHTNLQTEWSSNISSSEPTSRSANPQFPRVSPTPMIFTKLGFSLKIETSEAPGGEIIAGISVVLCSFVGIFFVVLDYNHYRRDYNSAFWFSIA
ncbi:hypothetical protein CAPTEDRAFT_195071 [Capitella teleta]|uniref:Uncharacterized protein n=1 Tax=Capitella teleta TaxID=283909 RepID=R7TXC6_CAPTE|nr:hypothetical protein CAPTEDRAFT_195071 [Capitella teleta]|eukprot:ELT96101.1 hypothetical protein CAPTEDRAFT_195071 [Capitella teleta]